MYESSQYDIVADYEPPTPVVSKKVAEVYPTSVASQIRSCFTSKTGDDLQEIAEFGGFAGQHRKGGQPSHPVAAPTPTLLLPNLIAYVARVARLTDPLVADYCRDEECVINAYLDDECVMDYFDSLDEDEVVLDRKYSFDAFQVRLHRALYEQCTEVLYTMHAGCVCAQDGAGRQHINSRLIWCALVHSCTQDCQPDRTVSNRTSVSNATATLNPECITRPALRRAHPIATDPLCAPRL